MYEHMLENYRVYFEGLPVPVFYGHYYPMGDKSYGSPLWNEFNYGRGLKLDKDQDGTLFNRFSKQYEADLKNLLNTVMDDSKGMQRGVVVIPSSTKGKINRVTTLTRKVLASNPRMFVDLTHQVTRSKDKDNAHISGNRSYSDNHDTIDVAREANLSQFKVLLVIDDILTTGTSFRAMDEKLIECGFGGSIINFAFASTYPSEGAECCEKWERPDSEVALKRKDRTTRNKEKPIEAIVFDLDQTLIDDEVRNTAIEEKLHARTQPEKEDLRYRPYDKISELMGLHIPFAIVSNRPEREIASLLLDQNIKDTLYQKESSELSRKRRQFYWNTAFGIQLPSTLPNNIFSFPTVKSGGYTIRYYKPSPRGVKDAISFLRREFLGSRNEARIVGLGNTYEDIVAYGTAGIESALALWGVPEVLKRHASKSWKADHVFESVADFTAWVKDNTDYCEMAQGLEEVDPNRAQEYYELAIRCGDMPTAAFKLARMLHSSNPTRAVPLYKIAIEAGEEYASANNLAILVQDDDPQQAITLYERSIVAGNEKYATRNLARLIGNDNAPRAVELLERAAAAGNEEFLASDLEPLIRHGSAEAIALYEKRVLPKDEKQANALATWIQEYDPDKAASLFKLAIDAGDVFYAARNLALLLRRNHPDEALKLLEKAAEAGNSDNLATDLEPMVTNGIEEAIALFEKRIVAPNEKLAFDLAQMVSAKNPEKARELYERAIAAGDEIKAAYNLGLMCKDDEPEKAKKLFRKAMDAGAEREAANALGVMVYNDNPTQAQALFKRSIEAGDEYYATVNLARMLRDDDPMAAIRLLRRATRAGRKDLINDLEPLVEAGLPEAADLYEESIVAENPHLAYNLACMIEPHQPKRAEELYERAIAAGEEYYSPSNLGFLIMDERPRRAAELFSQSMAAGNTTGAANGLGLLAASHDTSQAASYFQQAIEAGDAICATCNLAHLYAAQDPDAAIALYEKSASHDTTEAIIGLSFLIRRSDPKRSSELVEKARGRDDRKNSTLFLLELMGCADKSEALDAARFLYASGFDEARDGLIKLLLGNDRLSQDGTVRFGASPDSSEPLEWIVAKQDPNKLLLLSKNAVRTMPFCEDESIASWEDSTIRRWLNSQFVAEWLTGERTDILLPHPATGDLVYCLTPAEFDQLQQENGELTTCKDRSTLLEANWWLRPDEAKTLSAPYVTKNGQKKWCIAFTPQGVRPVIELNLNATIEGKE